MYYHTHYSCVMYSPNVQLLICTLLSILGILTKQMMNHKASCSQQQNTCKREIKKKHDLTNTQVTTIVQLVY